MLCDFQVQSFNEVKSICIVRFLKEKHCFLKHNVRKKTFAANYIDRICNCKRFSYFAFISCVLGNTFVTTCNFKWCLERPIGFTAVFFNRDFAEPQGSVSGCQGSFPPKRTETAWDEICNHSYLWLKQYRHLDHCIVIHEQGRLLQNVPLQRYRNQNFQWQFLVDSK